MLTNREIVLGILLPLVASLLISAAGWWTKWRWLSPLAGGLGFLLGYASSLGSAGGFGIPRLPPSDGTDWLFWMAIPAIALAAIDAAAGSRWWLAILGVWSGVVVWAILKPLVPGTISSGGAIQVAITAAVLATMVALVQGITAKRMGHGCVALCTAIILFATGITVLASNLRTMGVYGLGAGAAIAGAALFAPHLKGAQSLAIMGSAILCGLLAGGHYYPEPGVSWPGVIVLALSPLLVAAGLPAPRKKPWLSILAVLLAVITAVGLIAIPAALAAKKAAEADPYGNTN